MPETTAPAAIDVVEANELPKATAAAPAMDVLEADELPKAAAAAAAVELEVEGNEALKATTAAAAAVELDIEADEAPKTAAEGSEEAPKTAAAAAMDAAARAVRAVTRFLGKKPLVITDKLECEYQLTGEHIVNTAYLAALVKEEAGRTRRHKAECECVAAAASAAADLMPRMRKLLHDDLLRFKNPPKRLRRAAKRVARMHGTMWKVYKLLFICSRTAVPLTWRRFQRLHAKLLSCVQDMDEFVRNSNATLIFESHHQKQPKPESS